MKEKIYKTMSRTGGSNIAMGILVMTVGIVAGVMLLITGGNLLKKRGNIIF